jgi:GTPase SAR1 family protein
MGDQSSYEEKKVQTFAKVNVCMVCFDLSDKKNFANVTEKWANEIGNCPKILVGCKSDEREDL